MEKEVLDLIEQFQIIHEKGWLPSINNSLGSVGLTFEKEINKTPDSLYFPDYYGTELKCTTKNSHYPLFLFTASFDGPTFPEINRIIEKYGYPDKDYPDKKVLFEKVNCLTKHPVDFKYKFQLQVDDKEEKLFLCVYNFSNQLIEKKSFVYLKTLKDHLVLKLNRLALIYAEQKQEEHKKYFKYNKMIIYRLRNFEEFIKLLKKGQIEVSIISRISKSGTNTGKYQNKNLVFAIKKYRIEKLFEPMYSCEYIN